MKWVTRVSAMILGVAVMTTPVWSQSGSSSGMGTSGSSIKVTGTVTDKSDDAIKVRTDAGTEMEFNFNDQVMVPTSIQEGSRVTIEYSQSGAGMIASRIEMAGTGTSGTTGSTYGTTGSGTSGSSSYGTGSSDSRSSDSRNNTNNTYGTGTGTGSADIRANNLGTGSTGTTGTGGAGAPGTNNNSGTYGTGSGSGASTSDNRANMDNRTGSTYGTTGSSNSGNSGAGATGSNAYGNGSRLPATASPLPLIGGLGAFSLLGAVGMAAVRRRLGR